MKIEKWEKFGINSFHVSMSCFPSSFFPLLSCFGTERSIHVAAVANVYHDDDQEIVLNLVEDSVVAGPDTVEVARPDQLLHPGGAGVVRQSLDLGIDLTEIGF